ncbi:MAG TPA: VWA domain-containing protein [Vicinamibacterales bacterium]|nr:VWA domain-containing protein [Vicinamibacterales bacterium]
MKVVLPLVILGGVCVAAQPPAGQPPTFSTGARTVAVFATVTETGGRIIPDLEQNAFEIDDNGKKQTLTLFANDVQPITVVMLLDRSGSMKQQFTTVERAAEAFVQSMGPKDKARIGSFSQKIQIDPLEFTSSHDEMLKILRNDLQEEGPTPLWNAINKGIDSLLLESGRRVVLVFTDGVDNPMNFYSKNYSLKDVMKRAEENDVMVYAIGLAGDNAPPGLGSGRAGGFPGGAVPGGRGMPGRPYTVTEKPDEGLPKIAEATGGGYFELTSMSGLSTTFSRVAYELHHQYALGFTPAALDDKIHTLTVRVSTPGMKVRARKSYLARRVLG